MLTTVATQACSPDGELWLIRTPGTDSTPPAWAYIPAGQGAEIVALPAAGTSTPLDATREERLVAGGPAGPL